MWKHLDPSGVERVLKGSVMTNVPGVRLRATAKTCTSNAWTTIDTWTIEDFDTDGMHDNSLNPSRITIRTPGKYLFLVHGSISMNSGTTALARFIKNGSTVEGTGAVGEGGNIASAYPSISDIRIHAQTILDLSVGDYIEMQVFHDAGGDRSFFAHNVHQNSFEAIYLGPGIMSEGGGMKELAYGYTSGLVTVTATTDPGTALVTLPSLTFDGRTTIYVEWSSRALRPASALNADCIITIWDNGVVQYSNFHNGLETSTSNYKASSGFWRYTPSAGAHTLILRGRQTGGNAEVHDMQMRVLRI